MKNVSNPMRCGKEDLQRRLRQIFYESFLMLLVIT